MCVSVFCCLVYSSSYRYNRIAYQYNFTTSACCWISIWVITYWFEKLNLKRIFGLSWCGMKRRWNLPRPCWTTDEEKVNLIFKITVTGSKRILVRQMVAGARPISLANMRCFYCIVRESQSQESIVREVPCFFVKASQPTKSRDGIGTGRVGAREEGGQV